MVVPGPEETNALFDGYLEYLWNIDGGEQDLLTIDCKYNMLGALTTGEHNWSQRPYLLQAMIDRGFRLVHIRRKNVLATVVSSLLSVRNQVWATEDLSRIKHTSVEVDCQTIEDSLRHREAEMAHFNETLNVRNTLHVDYEDILVDGAFTQSFAADLAEHLGVENRFSLEPKLKKIAPPLSDSIVNFSEVQDTLGGTSFEWMLNV